MPNSAFLNEVIRVGGLPVTRATAYEWMKRDGHDARTCDYTAFSTRNVVDAAPMSLAEVLELVGECA